MIKPMKIYIAHAGCKRRDITFPSGKQVTITQHIPYITSDPEELQAVFRMKFMGIKDLEDKDYKELITQPSLLPEVKRILNIKDAKPFVWEDPLEPEVKAKLEEHGYIKAKECHECKCDTIQKEYSDKELIEMLKARGYIGIRKAKTK